MLFPVSFSLKREADLYEFADDTKLGRTEVKDVAKEGIGSSGKQKQAEKFGGCCSESCPWALLREADLKHCSVSGEGNVRRCAVMADLTLGTIQQQLNLPMWL